MTTKKVSPKKEPTYTIQDCHIVNTNAPTNECTRDAVIALAKALEANANAISETARALKGGNVSMGSAIHVGNN